MGTLPLLRFLSHMMVANLCLCIHAGERVYMCGFEFLGFCSSPLTPSQPNSSLYCIVMCDCAARTEEELLDVENRSPLLFVQRWIDPLLVVTSIEQNTDTPELPTPTQHVAMPENLKPGTVQLLFPEPGGIVSTGSRVYLKFWYKQKRRRGVPYVKRRKILLQIVDNSGNIINGPWMDRQEGSIGGASSSSSSRGGGYVHLEEDSKMQKLVRRYDQGVNRILQQFEKRGVVLTTRPLHDGLRNRNLEIDSV